MGVVRTIKGICWLAWLPARFHLDHLSNAKKNKSILQRPVSPALSSEHPPSWPLDPPCRSYFEQLCPAPGRQRTLQRPASQHSTRNTVARVQQIQLWSFHTLHPGLQPSPSFFTTENYTETTQSVFSSFPSQSLLFFPPPCLPSVRLSTVPWETPVSIRNFLWSTNNSLTIPPKLLTKEIVSFLSKPHFIRHHLRSPPKSSRHQPWSEHDLLFAFDSHIQSVAMFTVLTMSPPKWFKKKRAILFYLLCFYTRMLCSPYLNFLN